jgi:hypothetical protein
MSDIAQKPDGTQFLDLASSIANVTCHYLQDGGIDSDKLQKLIGDKKTITDIARKNAHEMLQLVPDKVVEVQNYLKKFFLEVFNFKVNFSNIKFPEHKYLSTYCFNPRKWNEDQIFAFICKKWGISAYKYLSPVAENIDRKSAQVRPEGPYLFCHSGENEPDARHLGRFL